MEFGKLEDISAVNWSLPKEDTTNESRWSSPTKSEILFGSPAWSCKHWKGKIFPQKSSPDEFLYHYSRQFNCIELNTTHYRIPTVQNAKDWREQVPATFQFCPKLSKQISHSQTGLVDKSLISEWMKFLEAMEGNLGACFIQFHELFPYTDKHLLFKFLESWPDDFKLALEFRHASWFNKNKILPALADYLHKRGMGLVITDVAGRRDVLHSTVASQWTMVRIIGNDLDPSDETRLNDWSHRFRTWQDKGLKKAYFFLHQPDDNWTLEFAQMAHKVFSQAGFSDVPKISFFKERNLLDGML